MWGGVFVQEMDSRPESVGKHREGWGSYVPADPGGP